MKNALQMNGARPFMHVYVISPAAPLFLVNPPLPALTRCHRSGRLFGAHGPARYDSTLQRGWEREKRFGLSIRTRTRKAWDNFAGNMCGKTQAFDSV
jgi:hypothetical protein